MSNTKHMIKVVAFLAVLNLTLFGLTPAHATFSPPFGEGSSEASATVNTDVDNASSSESNVGVGIQNSLAPDANSNSSAIGGEAIVDTKTGDASSESGGNSLSVNQEATDLSRAVPNTYGSALTTSNGTCMGSSSANGSGAGFGIGVATTWTDHECQARYNATVMDALGERASAKEVMCNIREVYDARKRALTPCVLQLRFEIPLPDALKEAIEWDTGW